MRKIKVAAFVSLDGVIQGPGGPEEDPTGGFSLGGWTATYWDEMMGAVMGESFGTPFDLLLGRRTYDIFAAHWPYAPADDPIATTFNDITKYVATHRPESLTWQNTESLGADPVARLKALKQTDGPDLLTQGSGDLLQTIFASDLVDELNLWVFPVVLGKGKRLFGKGDRPAAMPGAFNLVSSKTSTTGVLMTSYARAGAVPTGSFQIDPPSQAEVERRRALR